MRICVHITVLSMFCLLLRLSMKERCKDAKFSSIYFYVFNSLWLLFIEIRENRYLKMAFADRGLTVHISTQYIQTSGNSGCQGHSWAASVCAVSQQHLLAFYLWHFSSVSQICKWSSSCFYRHHGSLTCYKAVRNLRPMIRCATELPMQNNVTQSEWHWIFLNLFEPEPLS